MIGVGKACGWLMLVLAISLAAASFHLNPVDAKTADASKPKVALPADDLLFNQGLNKFMHRLADPKKPGFYVLCAFFADKTAQCLSANGELTEFHRWDDAVEEQNK